MRPFLSACIAGVLMLISRPDPASAASAAGERDGAIIAHHFFVAGDLGAVIRKTVADSVAAGGMDFPREDWKVLFRQTLEEEFDRHLPDLEAPFGRLIAQSHSDAEMHAGAVFLTSPLGQRLIAVATAGSSGRVVPPITDAEKALIKKAGRDPNLDAFMAKGFSLPDPPPAVMQDFIAGVLPDVLIRFGEAAKAAEARRRASSAP